MTSEGTVSEPRPGAQSIAPVRSGRWLVFVGVSLGLHGLLAGFLALRPSRALPRPREVLNVPVAVDIAWTAGGDLGSPGTGFGAIDTATQPASPPAHAPSQPMKSAVPSASPKPARVASPPPAPARKPSTASEPAHVASTQPETAPTPIASAEPLHVATEPLRVSDPAPSSGVPSESPHATGSQTGSTTESARVGSAASAASSGASPSGAGGAGASSQGADSRLAIVDYTLRLSRRVMREQHYPEPAMRLGMRGIAQIRVTVRRDGTLATMPRLSQSSDFELLDEEALRMVNACAPFEPLPTSWPYVEAELVIPVRFFLKAGN
ncbi:TonB family protein [Myxococcaceae bacterium JPH2]|nr:TonB family protein [Myxococcaceae bacterium JPH2]